jgi:tryptophan 2,3-dioxygenase
VTTAYDRYVRASVLHSLQDTVTGTETELSFLVVCQVQELYFGLIARELDVVRAHLRADDVAAATFALRRAAGHFAALNASWQSLTWMRVEHFLPVKDAMTARFGKSSSLQSWKFRELAYLLGVRSAALAEPVRAMSDQHAELVELLTTPSVYHEALSLLHRHGHPIPAAALTCEPAASHEPLAEVESVWAALLSDRTSHPELSALGVALLAVADGFTGYREQHLQATHSTFGNRPGYYGTPGTEWLAEQAHDVPFPDLCKAGRK